MNTVLADRLPHYGARLGTERGSEPLRTKRRPVAVLLGHAGPWRILN